MKRIAIDHIEPGMLLAEDVFGPDGTVYLSEGTVLKERHRALLENLGIYSIEIKEVHPVSFTIGKEPEPKLAPAVSKLPPAGIGAANTVSGTSSKRSVAWQPNTGQILKRNRVYKQTLESFKSIYHDVSFGKPVKFEAVKATLTPLLEEITTENNILANLRMIEIADDYTYRHAIQVALLATMIGKWMSLPESSLADLAVAGLLHDLGKCQVPLSILNKPSRLSTDEFEIMKTHVLLSYAILQESGQENQDILRGVLEHHERMDGSGYPNRIQGNAIHLYARIIAVADVFDAMTSNRCYQQGVSPFTVAEEMLRISSHHLDVEIVSLFLQNISRFFVGNRVELSNGEYGSVVMLNPSSLARPLIRLEEDFIDLAKRFDIYISRVLK